MSSGSFQARRPTGEAGRGGAGAAPLPAHATRCIADIPSRFGSILSADAPAATSAASVPTSRWRTAAQRLPTVRAPRARQRGAARGRHSHAHSGRGCADLRCASDSRLAYAAHLARTPHTLRGGGRQTKGAFLCRVPEAHNQCAGRAAGHSAMALEHHVPARRLSHARASTPHPAKNRDARPRLGGLHAQGAAQGARCVLGSGSTSAVMQFRVSSLTRSALVHQPRATIHVLKHKWRAGGTRWVRTAPFSPRAGSL